MNFRQFTAYCFALVAIAALPGCGDSRPATVRVSGKVLIDGKPVEFGHIQVIPNDARAASGELGAGGEFTLTTLRQDDGCATGRHVVTVIANETINAQSHRWHAPKKYASPATSGLMVDITEPTDSLVIELTWDGEKPFIETFDAE
jgi:hypothetical protein